ncbi:DUF1275 domain-containing protein [Oleomonas cavernae]|uniref:DUF1275 domain-containing protein n=1 Tax=Oleomonas cavernae TaxID=2320859 RepID=A0A418WCK5_9PROT|nr:YoaK family protein [Oleomonas cavernae]RJF87724.1 DUF1275 domain-containing protein [Oleomonas cavernae]
MDQKLSMLLTFTGGYVDTSGFLALHGLLAAHVTGNFITFGAALAQGTAVPDSKLIAVPVFCLAVVGARLLGDRLAARRMPVLRSMLMVETLLLAIAAGVALWSGTFATADAWPALLTGVSLVAAMAVQTAAHRVHLAGTPMTTAVTVTTTQVMIDLTDLLRGWSPEADAASRARLYRSLGSLVAYAGGCLAAAGAFTAGGSWGLVLPPLVILVAAGLPAARLDGKRH